MNNLEVKTSSLSLILIIILGIIFIPLGVVSLANGLLNNFKIVPLGIGLMMLISFGAIIWLVRRGHSKSIKYFSHEGVTLNDGSRFQWSDLNRVVNQFRITSTAHGTQSLWRTEIHFSNGQSAWLIPTKISN